MANVNGNLKVQGKVLSLKLETLAANPVTELVEGRVWWDTAAKALKLFDGEEAVNAGLTQAELTTALLPYAETTDVTSAINAAVADLVSSTEMQGAIDNALAGLDFQADVLGLESDFVATAGRYIYVDGTTFATGVAAAAGDIVEVDAAGVITAVAYDVSAAGPGALTWNRAAANGGAWYRWNGTDWDVFGGLSGFTAGNGLQDSAGTVSVKPADSTIVVDASGVKVGDLSATYVTQAEKAGLATDAELTAVADDVTALQTQVGTFFFPFDSGATSATSHTVTHNLGFRWPIVQVVDKATNESVIPDSISFTDANELVVNLGVAATVLVQVSWYKNAA